MICLFLFENESCFCLLFSGWLFFIYSIDDFVFGYCKVNGLDFMGWKYLGDIFIL